MKKVIAILLITVMAFGAAACQKTPESPIVVGKDNERMIEQAISSTQPSAVVNEDSENISYGELCTRYGCPEHWQTELSEADGKLIVAADVPFTLPDVMNIPMARVSAGRFSQDMVYKLFHALCGDTPMYRLPAEMTKASYLEQIAAVEQMLTTVNSNESPEAYAQIQKSLKQLREDCAQAPDSVPLTEVDGTLETARQESARSDAASGNFTRLSAQSNPHTRDTMSFAVYNDVEYENTEVYSFQDEDGNTQVNAPSSGSHITFSRNMEEADGFRIGQRNVLADVTDASLSGGSTETILRATPAQARQWVENLLSSAGIEDMAIDRVELCSNLMEGKYAPQAIPQPTSQITGGSQKEQTEERHAYIFRLLRQLNGVSVESKFDYSSSSVDDLSYGRDWWYETLEIAVDDEGILSFEWWGPLDVGEVLTESASLLPFAEIERIFQRMMVVQKEPVAKGENMESLRYDVGRVELCLWRIIDKNSFTDGILVPVWNFYCAETLVQADGYVRTIDDYSDHPTLTINAVDGSVIDVFKGY